MEFSIFTQYGQFYIADGSFKGDTSDTDFWSDDAFSDRLAMSDGILAVSVENDEAIANGELFVHPSRSNDTNFEQFDHVVEASLLISSGTLQILDCPNSQVELSMQLLPDWYRVRVSSLNLANAYKEVPEDKYIIDIWKQPFSPKKVLKRQHRS